MTQVKICGLTRAEDVRLACELGADYLGFNFASISPRRVSPKAARALADAADAEVLRVGVFVDEDHDSIVQAVEEARLDLVQLHRPVEEAELASLPRPLMAVALVSGSGAELPADTVLAHCRSLLVDSAGAGRAGGTGQRFDWALVARRTYPVPVFLAGGLDPDNVAQAIELVRPAGVDVASGVERAPGIKDPDRMRRFFRAVREADARRR